MQIIATCPCGQQYNADSVQIGTPLQCSTCGQVFIITASPQSNQQPAPPSSTQTPYHLENRYANPGPPSQPEQVSQPVASAVNPPAAAAHEQLPLTPLDPSAVQTSLQSPASLYSPPKRRANLKAWFVSIGFGVGGLVLTVLCMILLRSGKPANGMDLTYLPADLSQFYFVNVGEMQSSKSGKEFLRSDFFAKQYFGSMEKITQLKLEEIESITVGYTDPEIENSIDRNAKNSFGGMNFGNLLSFCSVIRTKSEYDKRKIIDSLPVASKQEHSGHEYYLIAPVKSALSDTTKSMAFPNAKTILYGSEKEIKNALNGSKAPNNSLFSNVRPDDHVVVANKGGVQNVFGLVKSGLAVTFGDEVSGRMWTEFESANIAKQVVDTQREMKSAVGMLPNRMPPQHRQKFDQFMRKGDPLGIGDVQISGKTITASFSGKDKLVANAALSQAVVGMLHQFQSFDAFQSQSPLLVKNKLEKAQKDAIDMAKRMQKDIERINRANENKKNENKKTVKPIVRKTGIQPQGLNSLPRFNPAGGNKVNLLEVFDLTKDKIKGTWAFENETLVCKSIHFRPRIQFPYRPPEEYDFKLSFKQSAPRGNVSIIIPNQGESFSWILSSSNVHQFSVSRIKKNETKIRVDSIIKPNMIHTLVIQKRAGTVKAVFDGRILSEFKNDFRDLDEDRSTSINNKELLGFCCETNTVITAAELTEVKGKGSFVD